ncbi:cyclase [Thermogymnomonas acidicola]|uniref:Cyclase n=2 Tax=Thermogymnomonas acidicola TaxID=399579 RepID=A0AA37BQC1_9ARCH|nr:cyclase [Thermogymnomonas acidicola]
MPVWPTNPLPVIEPVGITSRDGYAIERISAMTHTGTHIDAPYHFIDGGATVDAIPVERLVSRGFCIRPGVRGEEISRADLERVWDRRFRGSAILIDTGWSRRRAFTKEFLYGFPGLSEDAADFLLSQEVGMVGIDTLGIEPYSHHGFEVHKRLLSAGVVIIEDMANLDALEAGREYTVVALPLKLRGASGSMARVIAMEVEW